MAFLDMLKHTCNIYHHLRENTSPGFGLPASPAFSYPDSPDHASVMCKFHTRTLSSVNVQQNEPNADLRGRVKLTLPIGTDIRLNDKIIHRETGNEYTADQPIPIRNHHMIVFLRRTTEQERL